MYNVCDSVGFTKMLFQNRKFLERSDKKIFVNQKMVPLLFIIQRDLRFWYTIFLNPTLYAIVNVWSFDKKN